MDRRIETRVVVPGGAAETLIQKDACELWWITVSVVQLGGAGKIDIYDGFDDEGKHEWQLVAGYSRQHNFIPCIPCDYGLTVVNDDAIQSYTIAWRPLKWGKLPYPKE
ncbi:hypothetical protein ES703_46316 [subsurface metagenome]